MLYKNLWYLYAFIVECLPKKNAIKDYIAVRLVSILYDYDIIG